MKNSNDSVNKKSKLDLIRNTDKDFVIVFLPGKDINETKKTDGIISEMTAELIKQNLKVGTFKIEKQDTDYNELIKNYKISEFPSVILLGKGCNGSVLTGEINKETLYAAFFNMIKQLSGCCPQ